MKHHQRLALLASCSVVTLVSAARADDAAQPDTPVDHYRKQSFSLVSGMDFLATTSGSLGALVGDTSLGIVNFGANARGVFDGFVVGGQIGVQYVTEGAVSEAVFVPGASFGYAFRLSDQLALTPSLHAVFAIPTSSTLGTTSTTLQLTGEVGLEIFLGKHGFIEPVLAVGDYQSFSPGGAALLIGGGYRLGVVF